MSTNRLKYLIVCVYMATSLFSQKDSYVDSLKSRYYQNSTSDSVSFEILKDIVQYYARAGEYDSMMKYSQVGLTKATALKNTRKQIYYYNTLGVSYWNKGNYDKAIEQYSLGISISRASGDLKRLSQIYNNLGLVYWNKSEHSKALELYFTALELNIKTGNKEGQASAYTNIGLIYNDMTDYKSALENFLKSLSICSELGDNQGKVENYINIGLAYEKMNNPEKALQYYTKALQRAQIIENDKLLALVKNNMAGIYQLKGEHEKALMYYEEALNAYEKIAVYDGLVQTLNNMAALYYKLNNTKKALEVLHQALKIESEYKLTVLEVYTRYLLAGVCAKERKYKDAYNNIILHKNLSDSINKAKNISTVNQLQKEREVKEKEYELNLIREKELAVKEAEKQKQRYLTFASLLVLLITIIFSVLLYKRFKITDKQKQIIQEQKNLVEHKQKEILDSINYAKRIQDTILANEKMITEIFPQNFILFKPKDIVSGDFYWTSKATLKDNKEIYFLAVCDSTGHGVPGAFMSLLNMGFLTEAVNEKGIFDPDKVFDYVRQRLISSVSKDGQQDGFDGILLAYVPANNQYFYAAANNAPVIVSGGKLKELETNKMPVGIGEKTASFSLFEINIQQGDMLYLYTDGYADQFGGPNGKKFKYKKLNELLLSNYHKPLPEQKQILETEFENWRGNLEQVDDVCIIGIKC